MVEKFIAKNKLIAQQQARIYNKVFLNKPKIDVQSMKFVGFTKIMYHHGKPYKERIYTANTKPR